MGEENRARTHPRGFPPLPLRRGCAAAGNSVTPNGRRCLWPDPVLGWVGLCRNSWEIPGRPDGELPDLRAARTAQKKGALVDALLKPEFESGQAIFNGCVGPPAAGATSVGASAAGPRPFGAGAWARTTLGRPIAMAASEAVVRKSRRESAREWVQFELQICMGGGGKLTVLRRPALRKDAALRRAWRPASPWR